MIVYISIGDVSFIIAYIKHPSDVLYGIYLKLRRNASIFTINLENTCCFIFSYKVFVIILNC